MLLTGTCLMDHLENGTEYNDHQLQAWLNSRSRICSSALWAPALKGLEAFEVGDHTYRLTPLGSGRYRVICVKTSDIISAAQKVRKTTSIAGRRPLTLKAIILTTCIILYYSVLLARQIRA